MSEPVDPYRTPSAPPPPPGPPAVGARPGLPWDREKSGEAFLDTVKRLVTVPAEAYRETRQKGDFVAPLIFGIVLTTVGTLFNQLWSLLFGNTMLEWMAATVPPDMRTGFEQMSATPSLAGVLFALVLAPFVGAIVLFLWSGILHLALLVVGGTRDSVAGFEGTFRTVSYASVSNLALVVPLVGQLIGFFWSLVLQVLGLSEIHGTSRGKAIVAVLLPLILCCVCLVAAGALFGAAIGAAIAGAGQ